MSWRFHPNTSINYFFSNSASRYVIFLTFVDTIRYVHYWNKNVFYHVINKLSKVRFWIFPGTVTKAVHQFNTDKKTDHIWIKDLRQCHFTQHVEVIGMLVGKFFG